MSSLTTSAFFFFILLQGHFVYSQSPVYDLDIAWDAVKLSAIAYADDAPKALSTGFPNQSPEFTDVLQVFQGDFSGYVGVWGKKGLIVVGFRGTDGGVQFVEETASVAIRSRVRFEGLGRVQRYFRSGFYGLWKNEGLGSKVVNLANAYTNYKILVTGHSLGGALASLASSFVASQHTGLKSRIMMYTFGMPRVGDYDYALAHDRLVKASWFITQRYDPIPLLPLKSMETEEGPFHHGINVYYSKLTSCDNFRNGSAYELWYGPGASETYGVGGFFSSKSRACISSLISRLKKYVTKQVKKVNLKSAPGYKDHVNYFGVNVGSWWMDVKGKLSNSSTPIADDRTLFCSPPPTTDNPALCSSDDSGTINGATTCMGGTVWITLIVLAYL